MATQKPPETPATTSKSSLRRSSTKAAVTRPIAVSKRLVTNKKPKGEPGDLPLTGELSKKDLLERVVAESDMKKGEARKALNALLSVMHDALSEGKSISAAPLGKIKIARRKQTPNGELAVLRVKLKSTDAPSTPKANKDPVADPGE